MYELSEQEIIIGTLLVFGILKMRSKQLDDALSA